MADVTIFYEGPIVTRASALADGLKRYFTGKSCKRGHVDQRYIDGGQCRRCKLLNSDVNSRKERFKQWRKQYLKARLAAAPVCSVPKCLNHSSYKALRLCKKHYLRRLRHGDVLKALQNKGNGFINDEGYRIIYKPDHPNATAHGNILEHRFLMSEHLGRPLFEDETVHHINGHKSDNRLENLELWCSTQPSGQRVDDILSWARVIIDRYGDLVEKAAIKRPNTNSNRRRPGGKLI